MFRPDRLLTLSDGVLAFAMTLLVLGLEVPSVHDVPERQLVAYLLDSVHSVMGYITSFVLIGTYWLQHYAMFHYITRVDRVLVALNGVFLLSASFVPFPTGLQAVYREDELAMILYASTQIVCGFTLWSLWRYATARHRLVPADIRDRVVTSLGRRILLTPVVGLVAIVVSFINLDSSRLIFLVIPIAWVSHRIADQDWVPSRTPADSGDAASAPRTHPSGPSGVA
jgi:uncharacterized membrane protein